MKTGEKLKDEAGRLDELADSSSRAVMFEPASPPFRGTTSTLNGPPGSRALKPPRWSSSQISTMLAVAMATKFS